MKFIYKTEGCLSDRNMPIKGMEYNKDIHTKIGEITREEFIEFLKHINLYNEGNSGPMRVADAVKNYGGMLFPDAECSDPTQIYITLLPEYRIFQIKIQSICCPFSVSFRYSVNKIVEGYGKEEVIMEFNPHSISGELLNFINDTNEDDIESSVHTDVSIAKDGSIRINRYHDILNRIAAERYVIANILYENAESVALSTEETFFENTDDNFGVIEDIDWDDFIKKSTEYKIPVDNCIGIYKETPETNNYRCGMNCEFCKNRYNVCIEFDTTKDAYTFYENLGRFELNQRMLHHNEVYVNRKEFEEKIFLLKNINVD